MNWQKRHLENNPFYYDVKEFLTSVENKQIPTTDVIQKLYGSQMIDVVSDNIKTFLINHSADLGIPRKHFDSPLEIRTKRKELENDNLYYNIHSQIIKFELPPISQMKHLYAEYSTAVLNHFERCFDSRLIRKCGLSIAAHHNRVAAVVSKLRIDIEDPNKYTAISALHDSIEDLLSFTTDKKGVKYGIFRYQEFINEFIPEKIRSEICLLTNHYDLILEQLKNDFHYRDMAFTKLNIINELGNILKQNVNGLRHYYEKIIQLIENLKEETNLYRNIKWLCYQNYIREMAETAQRSNNYKVYIIKAIDLLDNCHGSDALDRDGKIKNILKLGIWAKQGYELSTTYSLVNNCVMELYEEALNHSEFLILNDLLQEESKLDFLMVALNAIIKLKSILFTDKSLTAAALIFEQSNGET